MYVGVTNDLLRRVEEHRSKLVKGFTEKYNVNKLVYFEQTSDLVQERLRGGSGEEGQLGDEH